MLVDGTQLTENLSEHLMGKQWLMIRQGEEKDTYEVVSQGMGHNDHPPSQNRGRLPEFECEEGVGSKRQVTLESSSSPIVPI